MCFTKKSIQIATKIENCCLKHHTFFDFSKYNLEKIILVLFCSTDVDVTADSSKKKSLKLINHSAAVWRERGFSIILSAVESLIAD